MRNDIIVTGRAASAPMAPRSFSAPAIALLLSGLALGSACGDDGDDPATEASDAAATAEAGPAMPGSMTDGSVAPGIDAAAQPPNTTPADGGTPGTNADGALPPILMDAGPVAPPPANALYAVGTWVTSGDDTTAYVKAVPSLDTDVRVTLADALEVAGYGDIHVESGKLYVSDGEAPIIRRYAIAADGKFTQEMEINFSRYTDDAAMYTQRFVDANRAYLRGETGWIKWNPTTMRVEKEIEFPAQALAPRDGLEPFVAYDRGSVARGDRLFHSFYWADFETYDFAPVSGIIVLDTNTDQVVSVLEAPCPGLDLGSLDDAGNLYFSGWTFNAGYTLVNEGAKSCAVKIAAGSDALDPSFSLVFADVTGGHEGANMRYLGETKFLLSVFDEKRTPYDPSTMTIEEWVLADNWTFGLLDLATKAFTPLPALGYQDGAYYAARPANQFFLLTRSTDDGSTTYQQLMPDGSVKKGISIDGWSTKVYRVR